MAQDDTLSVLVREVGRALLPLREALSSVESFQGLMLELGWTVDDIPPPVQNLLGPLDDLASVLEALIEGTPTLAEIDAARQAVVDVVAAIDALRTATFDPALAADDFATHFPAQLLEHLLITYLLDFHPKVEFTLRLLGLIRATHVPASGNRPDHVRRELVWADFTQILSDPFIVLERAYGWRTPQFQIQTVLNNVQDLMLALGVPVFREAMSMQAARVLENNAPVPGNPIRIRLNVPLFDQPRLEGDVRAGLALLGLPPDGASLPGLALMPYAEGDFGRRYEITPQLTFILDSGFDLQGGVGLKVRPGEGVQAIVGFNDPASATTASGMIAARLEFQDPSREPVVLIGSRDGSHIEMKSISGTGGLYLDSRQRTDLYAELELQEGRLVIAPGSGDGFLQKILPRDGFSVRFDLAVGLSSERGFYFRGSDSLEVNIPTHLQLGAIGLESVIIAVRPTADSLPISAGAIVKAQLGPILATVENLGIEAEFRFPGSGGNVGPLDLQVKFKAPDRVGLLIDSGSVVGGGYLFFDPAEDQYAGAVQLEFNTITLQGVGLITTRLPGGASGFSMLVIITAEGFTPINLGLGFTLNGVGGLLAVNRTVAVEPLRLGLKQRSLDAVLFPKDPVANAPQIVSNLRQLFPVKPDQFAFGPMAIIGWGTPTVLTIELALVLEFPSPFRLIALGQFRALLPSKDQPLVRLNMDALGVVDFDRGELAIDATLYDSRILDYSVSGDMALRVRWNDDPTFLLAVGGFHPRFQPPPGFPALDRVAINLTKGNNPRLRLTAYLALTSNTAQIGARLDLFAALGRASVEGHLSFDALIQFAPFQFVVDLGAAVTFKYRGRTLLGVSLEMTLSGPAPWHARGKATIDLWLFSVSVRFDETFGDAAPATLPSVDPLPELLQALGNRHHWSAQRPKTRAMLVTLREIPAADEVLVHPLGRLSVRQRVLPLNVEISRFGNTTPSGERRFSITQVAINGIPVEAREPTRDFFARAQFIEMSDAQKLTAPSFDEMESGVEFGADPVAYGGQTDDTLMVTTEIAYEECILGDEGCIQTIQPYDVTPESLAAVASMSAAGRSAMRHTGRDKYRAPALPVAFAAVTYVVARTTDLTVEAIPELDGAAQGATYTAVHEALARHLARHPEARGRLQIVPRHEAKGATV
jgi:hypothetical protein